jgi:hypothetical protein
MAQPAEISTRFAAALEERLNESMPNTHQTAFKITVMAGQRFDRIVQEHVHGDKVDKYSRSVHAFVERSTGALVKASGWKAPASSKTHPSGFAVRFDLSTEDGFNDAITKATFSGGYLYA